MGAGMFKFKYRERASLVSPTATIAILSVPLLSAACAARLLNPSVPP